MTFWNYDLNEVVKEDHDLKKINELISFSKMAYRIKDCSSELGRSGYGLEVALKCLFLQFYYDFSDRKMETMLRDSIAMRWFCNFKIDDNTPDHSFFGRARKLIGTERIGKIFNNINKQAEENGFIGKIFNFADASSIKAKETTWEEYDRAMKQGEEKLNNKNISNFSADKDARFGCKGKSKYWYGYKRNVNRDMKQGLITTVAVTPANISDQQAFRHVCPKGGMVFADKAYCLKPAQLAMQANGCHSGAILRDNMKDKNKDLDKWLTKVRMPFEGAFSSMSKKTRYRGIAKVQMQAFLEAIVFNVKRLALIGSPPLFEYA